MQDNMINAAERYVQGRERAEEEEPNSIQRKCPRESSLEEVPFEWNLEGQVVVCQVERWGKGRLGRESCVRVQVYS